MPTYEYKCRICGHEFEVIQSIKDDSLSKCPECGKDEAERQISAGAGLIFKGSGFYITDYRSESYKKDAKNDKPKSDKPKTEKSKTEKTKSESKSTADKPKPKSPSSQSSKSGD